MSDKIILRVDHFMKNDDFEKVKTDWETRHPECLVIPYTMSVGNPRNCRGHWIEEEDKQWNGHGLNRCSICGYGFSWGQYDKEEMRFCPHCGAQMIKK